MGRGIVFFELADAQRASFVIPCIVSLHRKFPRDKQPHSVPSSGRLLAFPHQPAHSKAPTPQAPPRIDLPRGCASCANHVHQRKCLIALAGATLIVCDQRASYSKPQQLKIWEIPKNKRIFWNIVHLLYHFRTPGIIQSCPEGLRTDGPKPT